MNKRVNYVDNLRTITVSLLIVYHVAMAYNIWDEANYIFFKKIGWISAIVVLISPWFMPFMFMLAGVSAFYSLRKRSMQEFVKERIIRLGIPLIFGLIFINPILSYVADKTHNEGFMGSVNTICNYMVFAIGVLAWVCIGHDYMDGASKWSRYFAKLSYVYYIVHFPVVVLCQYFLSVAGIGIIVNFIFSIIIADIVTAILCILIEKSGPVKILFGLK